MGSIEIREVKIGEGKTKVCVSLIGRTEREIQIEVAKIKENDIDIVEWRCDFYESILDVERTKKVLRMIREQLPNHPLLFTFRTKDEGGELAIDLKDYQALYQEILNTPEVDIIDLQLFLDEDLIVSLIEIAKTKGKKILLSNHDFSKTPPKEELLARYMKMQTIGADILKVAVMPNSHKDVLTLLEATCEMKNEHAKVPVVGISMGQLGMISRFLGEWSGSALTFGAIAGGSAPGQMKITDLHQILEILNKNFS